MASPGFSNLDLILTKGLQPIPTFVLYSDWDGCSDHLLVGARISTTKQIDLSSSCIRTGEVIPGHVTRLVHFINASCQHSLPNSRPAFQRRRWKPSTSTSSTPLCHLGPAVGQGRPGSSPFGLWTSTSFQRNAADSIVRLRCLVLQMTGKPTGLPTDSLRPR